MQKLQRKMGGFLTRSADDAEVSVLLQEFEEGDKLLKIVIESAKAFRNAWTELLQRACGMVADFDALYQFIPGVDAADNAKYRPTTQDQLAKVNAFKVMLADVRDVMIQELAAVDRSVSSPAKEARKHIDTFRKTIKKREDRKLDWERYKSRTEAIERKSTRSERDNMALMKHQIDLDISEKAYHTADEALRANLPGLIQAIFGLVPRLVHALCMVQNTLLGHYYTALHDFCQQYGYLIPTPEWQQVAAEFDDAFGPAKRETERLSTLQRGKAVKGDFYSRPDSLQTRTVSHGGAGGLALAPTRSNGRLPPPVPAHAGGGGLSPVLTPPPIDLSSRPGGSAGRASSTAASPSLYGRPSPPASTASFHTAATTRSDFFAAQPTSAGAAAPAARRSASLASSPYLGSGASVASAASSLVAGKKKPPPPPPKRRPEPKALHDYVVAQYDFAGQGQGDLSFREGDRIRVTVRTASTNDWWEGECAGARGSFPANYCKSV